MNRNRCLNIIKNILKNSIHFLKDEAYQRRVWFRGEGPEVDSYIDTNVYLIERCESFFEDPDYSEFLGKENCDLLRKLYNLVRDHVNMIEMRMDASELKENELLDDPKWHDIQSLAAELEIKLNDFVKRESDSHE